MHFREEARKGKDLRKTIEKYDGMDIGRLSRISVDAAMNQRRVQRMQRV